MGKQAESLSVPVTEDDAGKVEASVNVSSKRQARSEAPLLRVDV